MNSPEAIAAAREIKDEIWPNQKGSTAWIDQERIETISKALPIIQKHYAAKDEELDQLKARVAELEKNANSWWEVLEMIPEGTAGTTDGEKVKFRLQELDRKAKALDWFRNRPVDEVVNVITANGDGIDLLSAIASAMEKQK